MVFSSHLTIFVFRFSLKVKKLAQGLKWDYEPALTAANMPQVEMGNV